MRKLTGNRIVCSSKYEADDNNEADVKLHEEINKLKTEIVYKENFIIRLQKTAKDFENDVLEIELKFIEEQKINKEQLKVQKEKLCIRHQDLIQTENKNTELLITIEDYQKQLREAEKIINNLRSIESEMLTSMSILEQTNDTYAKEIDSLHRRSGTVNGRLLNQDQGDQEYQENPSSHASSDSEIITPVANIGDSNNTTLSDTVGRRQDNYGYSVSSVIVDEHSTNVERDMVPKNSSLGLTGHVANVDVSPGISAVKKKNIRASLEDKKVPAKQKKKIVVVGDELSLN
nr:unnamed protein product [Callosobruchus analis]